jgi:hypothetical protein
MRPMTTSTINGFGVLRTVLEEACQERKLTLNDLTVLSRQVDPYRRDTPSDHRDGKWVAEQLNALFGSDRRTHWRGLYYAIVAAGNIRKPDGEPFIGTVENWEWLSAEAGKAARWLGYIPFDRITDSRNAPPIIHRKPRAEIGKFVGGAWLNIDIPDADDIDPHPFARGFQVRQAFHFVIFGEKSSLEDAVLPVAMEFEADLYLPTGEISDTLIYQIARDATEDGRPLVMFTLSDCDPSGYQMPISIGRKLQAFKDLHFPDLEFELVPVALTPEQARAGNLPETPLKETEKRASRWRDAFGCGQTEIDALTIPSKVPVLQRYLREAFAPYIDTTLSHRVWQAEAEWREAAQQAIDDQIDADRLERIRAEASTKLETLREEIERLNEALSVACDDLNIELPDIEVPEPEVELEEGRQALLSFDHDWVDATQALIERKSYGGAS